MYYKRCKGTKKNVFLQILCKIILSMSEKKSRICVYVKNLLPLHAFCR